MSAGRHILIQRAVQGDVGIVKHDSLLFRQERRLAVFAQILVGRPGLQRLESPIGKQIAFLGGAEFHAAEGHENRQPQTAPPKHG
ncbi:MAG: hypothetical protein BWZ10_01513 [candidate division BRC1 bacterium ADurb.BinA364]|nr:MAG: hypothetical protein BWZ10_01513 [candidate division BRC1 bacterium ADurb.BinA364]